VELDYRAVLRVGLGSSYSLAEPYGPSE